MDSVGAEILGEERAPAIWRPEKRLAFLPRHASVCCCLAVVSPVPCAWPNPRLDHMCTELATMAAITARPNPRHSLNGKGKPLTAHLWSRCLASALYLLFCLCLLKAES